MGGVWSLDLQGRTYAFTHMYYMHYIYMFSMYMCTCRLVYASTCIHIDICICNISTLYLYTHRQTNEHTHMCICIYIYDYICIYIEYHTYAAKHYLPQLCVLRVRACYIQLQTLQTRAALPGHHPPLAEQRCRAYLRAAATGVGTG